MPTKRKNPIAGRRGTPRRGSFICPECGFKAKHAMGLGRHRTAIHGVASLRERAMKGRRTDGRTIAALTRRLDRLEKQVASLVKGLRRLG